MTAGHLVARLQAALDGQVHLDHLEHAGGQLIALRELLALFFERQVEVMALLLDGVLDGLQLGSHIVFGWANVEPVEFLHAVEIRLVDLRTLSQLLRTTVGHAAIQQLGNTVERVGLNDAQLVVQVQTETLEFIIDDLLSTLVALDAFTGEDLHVDHGTLRALIHTQ
ncbi:hypothetical protein D3C72_1798590 [compost metagenome]